METVDSLDTLLIASEDLYLRIDKLLAEKYPDYSRTYFQNLLDKGHVLVNGSRCKKRQMLNLGDEVEVCFELPSEIPLDPEDIPLEILYEDAYIIIVNKPPGMVVHPAVGNPNHTFVNALLFHCKGLPIDPQAPLRPGIVHRLDKNTSGALVAAKTSQAHRGLVELFSHRKVIKTYKALCLNTPSEGTITTQLKRHPSKRQEMAVCTQGGKTAITQVKVCAKNSKTSLVQLQLITGRTHQIRVHLKHLGCPILGDPVYGSKSVNQQLNIERQLLHAETLSFTHPVTQAQVFVEAPMPQDMESWIQKLYTLSAGPIKNPLD